MSSTSSARIRVTSIPRNESSADSARTCQEQVATAVRPGVFYVRAAHVCAGRASIEGHVARRLGAKQECPESRDGRVRLGRQEYYGSDQPGCACHHHSKSVTRAERL